MNVDTGKYIPPEINKYVDIKHFNSMISKEFEQYYQKADIVEKAIFVNETTDDEILQMWEKDYGIKSDQRKNVEERQNTIISAIRTTVPFSCPAL